MRYGFDYITSGSFTGDWQELVFLEDTTATLTTTTGDTLTDVSFSAGQTIVGPYEKITITSGGAIAYRRRNVTKRALTDADFQAVLNKGTAEGYSIPTGTALTAGDTLVRDLKSAGVWDKLDLFYVFATNGDSDFATLNWKAPASFQATKVNAPTFTSLEGFTGNGTSSYLDTNWRPNPDGVNYQINNASLAFYSRSNRVDGVDIGTRVSGTDSNIFIASLSGATIGNATINSTDNTSANFANADGRGFYMANRTNSANHVIYKNGASVTTLTRSSELNAVPPLFVGALNQAGTPIIFSQKQISIVAAGADLSIESSDFYTAIQNYMTAIGKEV